MRKRHYKNSDKIAEPKVLTLVYKGIDHHPRPDPDTKQHVMMGRAESNDGRKSVFFLKDSTAMRGEEGAWSRKLKMNQVFTARVLSGYVQEVEPELEEHAPAL
jgi:hypothetical protein